eukprot:Phypoly_transcript_16743.p1 GENE.Phypoly_transcript_16743~~Phypoly_transcript_16743.p1  ORF type:complete len:175 (+),score=27.28 Phypoly_transcript_16743:23-526(+)
MNTILFNKATLEVMIWQFSDQTSVTFANATTSFPPNTLKLAIQITNWPFQSIRDSLEIILGSKDSSSQNVPDKCKLFEPGSDTNQNLKYFTFNVNGATLFGQFENKALVDELVRVVNFTLSADNFVVAKLPHFWNSAGTSLPSPLILISKFSRKIPFKLWIQVTVYC